jgi:ABC-type sugar transport system ATPase subunit
VQSNTDAPTSAVEMNGLRVRYRGIEAVASIDLTIERGAVVVLLAGDAGRSGVTWSSYRNC